MLTVEFLIVYQAVSPSVFLILDFTARTPAFKKFNFVS
jgi:hypothetical protein